MGGTPPPVPVTTETEDAVQQTQPQTMAEVVEADSSGDELNGEWFAIRNEQGQFLGEVEHTGPQPYATTSGWAAFGPQTYFYGAQAEAEEVTAEGGTGTVVPINVRCTVGC